MCFALFFLFLRMPQVIIRVSSWVLFSLRGMNIPHTLLINTFFTHTRSIIHYCALVITKIFSHFWRLMISNSLMCVLADHFGGAYNTPAQMWHCKVMTTLSSWSFLTRILMFPVAHCSLCFSCSLNSWEDYINYTYEESFIGERVSNLIK